MNAASPDFRPDGQLALPGTGLWALFALPRSRSTALFRAFTAREEFLCLHEPFCSLADTGLVRLPAADNGPTGAEVTVTSLPALADHIAALSRHRRVFLKETTDTALEDLAAHPMLRQARSIACLTRDPLEAIASHLKLRPEASLADLGYGHLRRLVAALDAGGLPLHLLRAEELAADPEASLRRYCQAAHLPFHPAMLDWPAEDRPEWQRTQRWHLSAAASTGFRPAGPQGEARAVSPEVAAAAAAVAADHQAVLARRLQDTWAEGGCSCGALRYRLLQAPRDLTECFCTQCRRSSGATRLAWGTVDVGAFILSGRGRARHATSPTCERGFCMTCGTQLTFFDKARPHEIDFTLASLDRPGDVAPVTALHVAERIEWDIPSSARQLHSAGRGTPIPAPQSHARTRSTPHDA